MVTPDPHLSRRTLLLGGAGLAGMGLLAACGSGSGKTSGGTTTSVIKLIPTDLQILLASFDHLPGSAQRVAFGLADKDNAIVTAPVVSFRFGPDEKHLGAPRKASLSTPTGGNPYYTGTFDAPAPGSYILQVTADRVSGTTPIEVVDPTASKTPVPGRPLVSTPTPTPTKPLDANPYCTRTPVCDLHAVSLDTALTMAKPIAVLFATPALCSSRFCGPMLDILLSQQAAFGGKVQLIHVEIYKDSTGQTVLDAVRAFGFQNEPYLFLANAKGIVTERISGPFTTDDAEAALTRLL